MTRLPPLSPELEAIFAPLRTPSPLPPVVVSRVMARALAARELTFSRRKHGRLGFWAFAAIGGALLTVGAGPPVSTAASLVACAVLLPLMPFHDGHLTALTRLPGSLPAFSISRYSDNTFTFCA